MKKSILSFILALAAQFSFAAVPDNLKKDLEDYDYLVSFVEENYAPFDAIMQKGYKREYKVLKKQLRKQLCNGEADYYHFLHSNLGLRLKACLPYGFYSFAEVVEDMTALNAATSREETTDNAGDVTADVECLRIVHTDALYPKTETTDTWKYDCVTIRKLLFQDVLYFSNYTHNGALLEAAVATSLSGYLIERYLTLTDCFCKIFPIRAAALDIVLYKFNMYCHFFY